MFRRPFWRVWLSKYRWYRRWYGGRWEKWCTDHPVCSDIWYNDCVEGERPCVLCRGTPVIEDYTT
jgi:hypothetical protein